MVYRLLTTGSVEIDMMEKQISKKKVNTEHVQPVEVQSVILEVYAVRHCTSQYYI
jgi:SNF2 family DNA or RNA helicase